MTLDGRWKMRESISALPPYPDWQHMPTGLGPAVACRTCALRLGSPRVLQRGLGLGELLSICAVLLCVHMLACCIASCPLSASEGARGGQGPLHASRNIELESQSLVCLFA